MSPWATSTRPTRAVETVDYLIVGAGSAGCVLADRLTEDGEHSVLVLEYGGSDRSPWIQMPSAFSIPMNMARYDWRYCTEPEPHLNGRRLHTARGKVLGGSSSINGLVYVRGNPLDFERWEAEGATGWSYHDVLPYFKRAERGAGGSEFVIVAAVSFTRCGHGARSSCAPVRSTRPSCCCCRASARNTSSPRTASRWCASCRVWARTCRIIWSSTSRSPAASPSPFIRSYRWCAARSSARAGSSAATASAPAITSRPAASSAAAPGCATRTSSFIFCRRRRTTT